MRALTVKQPHASLIVAGLKPVDVRRPVPVPPRHPLRQDDGPRSPGAGLGTVQVTGCHHADDCRWYERAVHDDGRRSARLHGVHHCSPSAEPNTYHWTLADPVELDEPIPMRGRQGLWTVPDDVLAEVGRMIPRPRLRRRRFRLPDRTRPLALPNEACVVCGGPGAHAANGYYCPSCKPVHQAGQNFTRQTEASR